jgi:FecR protein
MTASRRGVSAGFALTLMIVLLQFPVALGAQEVGRIEYLEGIVDIHREGTILELYPSDIGFPVEAVDTIRTGPDGRVDFTLTNLRTGGSSISVGSNTAFRIESSLDSGVSKTRIEIFSGSVSLKIAKLSGMEDLSVRTESAAMGVRGTSFEVLTAPDGGVLVLCDEGRVSCTDFNQQEVMAYTGQAVEKVPGDRINPLEVDPQEYDEFRQKWRETRLEIFRSGAGMFVRAYAQQYQRIQPRFDAAYAKLAPFEPRLVDYGRRAADGRSPLSRGDLVRFRAEISPALAEMRSVIPFYRQTFFRLSELMDYVRVEGLARNERIGDVTAARFFSDFSGNLRQKRERIAKVEYWFKLYTALSRGSGNDPFGGESLMDDFFAPGESSLLEEF